MPTLIYKRTHNGDPDPHTGTFGNHDCMGRVRAWPFDAVIGVGGAGTEPVRWNIAGKVTWVGIGVHPGQPAGPDHRGPTVMFDHFLYLGEDGPLLADLAPNLAARMYGHNVRAVMHRLPDEERAALGPRSPFQCGAGRVPERSACRWRQGRRSQTYLQQQLRLIQAALGPSPLLPISLACAVGGVGMGATEPGFKSACLLVYLTKTLTTTNRSPDIWRTPRKFQARGFPPPFRHEQRGVLRRRIAVPRVWSADLQAGHRSRDRVLVLHSARGIGGDRGETVCLDHVSLQREVAGVVRREWNDRVLVFHPG